MNKNIKKPSLNSRGPNAIWLLLFFVVTGVLYLFWYNSVNREVEPLTYSKLLAAVEEDRVASVSVQDQFVQGKFKNTNKLFSAYVVPSEKLWDLMKQHGVDMEVYPQEKQPWGTYIFLTIFFFILLFLFVYFKQGQGGGGGSSKIFSVGKSRARFFSPNTITTTFKDVAGLIEVKEDLKDIIEFLKSPEKFERLGAKIPRGVLLNGAPGNGKTVLAKAVAGEASCPFFSISGSDFVEVFVGVGASRVRDLFAQAKRNSPCIVFIDEIDAVGRQRGIGLGGGNDEREQTLNQLLSEMDGFSTEHGAVIILAATNRPDVLDKALMRPGRFDRIIEVPFPDLTSREEILKLYAKRIKLDSSVDLSKVARGTPGFSGADLESLINEAALQASKANDPAVTIDHIERARDKLMLGAERKTMVLTEKDKLMTAYHEAGHALLNVLMLESDPFHKVTIIPRGRTMGVSWSLPERDKYNRTKDELLAQITRAFGGLLSEKMVFNQQTTGAKADIENATKVARDMVCQFGMSGLGPVDFSYSVENPYLGRDIQNTREYSERTSQRVDEEVEKIVKQCYDQGERLLRENRDKLDLLAKKLVEKETLHAKEVYDLLGIEPRELHTMRSEGE